MQIDGFTWVMSYHIIEKVVVTYYTKERGGSLLHRVKAFGIGVKWIQT
jgi:hypothetical protein